MRNSPWSLLALSTSILALIGAALFLPTLDGGSGKRQSVWDLLLEWHPSGAEILQDAGPLIPQAPQDPRNTLARGLHVLVQVEDQAGNPLQGVKVSCDLVTASSIGRIDEGMTNVDGRFASGRLEPGTYEVQFEKPGFLATPKRTWTLPLDGETMQPIRLTAGCVVSGNLNGTDGAPRNHGILRMKQVFGDQELETEPDVHGGFLFPAVEEGPWILTWHAHRKASPGVGLERRMECVAGEPQPVVITLAAFDPRVPEDPDTLGIGIHVIDES